MTDQSDQTKSGLTAGLAREEWLFAIEAMAEDRGYFHPVGSAHSALFTDAGRTLLVTFETIDTILENDANGQPMGWHLADRHGWSQLCLMSDGRTWFRDPYMYAYFDRLVDDGFFEDFDRVVFYGAGPCGYAAAAYSVASPGATVVLIQPQATLDARDTPWDTRFPGARRRFLGNRYAYAPDMIDGADSAFVFYDPEQALDAAHAALFRRPHVTQLPLRLLGNRIESAFARAGVLDGILEAAMGGTLTATHFWALYRPFRRSHTPLMRQYLQHLIEQEKNRAIVHLARHVLREANSPRFRRAGDAAIRNLAKMGGDLRLDARKAPVS